MSITSTTSSGFSPLLRCSNLTSASDKEAEVALSCLSDQAASSNGLMPTLKRANASCGKRLFEQEGSPVNSDSDSSTPIFSDSDDEEANPRFKIRFAEDVDDTPKPKCVKKRTILNPAPIDNPFREEDTVFNASLKLIQKAQCVLGEYLHGNYQESPPEGLKPVARGEIRRSLQGYSLRSRLNKVLDADDVISFAQVLVDFKKERECSTELAIKILTFFLKIPDKDRSPFGFNLTETTFTNLKKIANSLS